VSEHVLHSGAPFLRWWVAATLSSCEARSLQLVEDPPRPTLDRACTWWLCVVCIRGPDDWPRGKRRKPRLWHPACHEGGVLRVAHHHHAATHSAHKLSAHGARCMHGAAPPCSVVRAFSRMAQSLRLGCRVSVAGCVVCGVLAARI
jgi:hypothetical protein